MPGPDLVSRVARAGVASLAGRQEARFPLDVNIAQRSVCTDHAHAAHSVVAGPRSCFVRRCAIGRLTGG